jgi:hypothetical protein
MSGSSFSAYIPKFLQNKQTNEEKAKAKTLDGPRTSPHLFSEWRSFVGVKPKSLQQTPLYDIGWMDVSNEWRVVTRDTRSLRANGRRKSSRRRRVEEGGTTVGFGGSSLNVPESCKRNHWFRFGDDPNHESRSEEERKTFESFKIRSFNSGSSIVWSCVVITNSREPTTLKVFPLMDDDNIWEGYERRRDGVVVPHSSPSTQETPSMLSTEGQRSTANE